MVTKKDKKTTIDELAIIINEGFDGQMDYMKKEFNRINGRFEQVDGRFSALEKDVKYIKENLKSAVELEKEVEYIKNTMGIPALKKI